MLTPSIAVSWLILGVFLPEALLFIVRLFSVAEGETRRPTEVIGDDFCGSAMTMSTNRNPSWYTKVPS